ncbi:MAG: hypothetical protein VKK97_05070 [Synechococcaceae cyanobacterium]|jgi:hypothetical protein|nr:hypothetical protein [Synechococcaceae cyanobacterium]
MAITTSMLGIRKRLLPLTLSLLAINCTAVAARAAQPQSTPNTTSSSASKHQSALAKHLRTVGAVFYGAWWCPHCTHQKEMFGVAALELLPYVECDKDDAGRRRCEEAQVRAYPTWDLKGERRTGVLSLEELARWSGYNSR